MVKRQKQKLKQIVYTSKPVVLEDNTIDEILTSSHKYNSQSGVTGLLIFGTELYMQFLEGPDQELWRCSASACRCQAAGLRPRHY